MEHEAKPGTTDTPATYSGDWRPREITGTGQPGNSALPLAVTDILEALPFYVMLVDDQHYILQANQAVNDQLGLKAEDIIGKYCPEVIHGLKEPWHACPLEEAAESGKAVEREAFDQKSGRWIRSAIFPTGRFTREGRRIFFHMVTDITDRKVAEEQVEIARVALKAYAAHIVTSQEEERRYLAHELHDDTIQSLVLLYRKLEAIGSNPSLPFPVVQELAQAQENSEGIIHRLRDFIRAIRPPILDDLGILPSIRRLLMDFTSRSGIEGNIQLFGEQRRLAAEVETGLFRIAQEALWNAERHSRARSVVVIVTFAELVVRLDITDDGVGFAVPAALTALSAGGHLGLIGMQERAESIGGQLEIASAPGKGTTVSITIPATAGRDNGRESTPSGQTGPGGGSGADRVPAPPPVRSNVTLPAEK